MFAALARADSVAAAFHVLLRARASFLSRSTKQRPATGKMWDFLVPESDFVATLKCTCCLVILGHCLWIISAKV